MAAIVNQRDVLLQATSPRMVAYSIDPALIPGLPGVIAASSGIKITAPSNVFQIASGGVASPTSILLTATLTNTTGAVTWTVDAGTATLTGSGNTRTLLPSNMTSNSVTIKASVNSYSDYFTIAKTADGTAGTNGTAGANGTNGTNGTAGTNGARGSLTLFGTLSNLVRYTARPSGLARWAAGSPSDASAVTADTAANTTIWNGLGNSGTAQGSTAHLRIGDTVGLTNSSQTVAVTGYWNGSNWLNPGTVIDGNLLVGGNIAGQTFNGGTFTGSVFSGTTSMSIGGVSPTTAPVGMYLISDQYGSGGGISINGAYAQLQIQGICSFLPGSASFSSKVNASAGLSIGDSIDGTIGYNLLRRLDGPLDGVSVATFNPNAKPGNSSTNTWLQITANGVVGFIPVWS